MNLADWSIDSDDTATFYFDDEYPFAVEIEYSFYEDSYPVWDGCRESEETELRAEWGVNDYWLTHPETGNPMGDPNHGLWSAKSCYESESAWIQRQIDKIMDEYAEKQFNARKENWI